MQFGTLIVESIFTVCMTVGIAAQFINALSQALKIFRDKKRDELAGVLRNEEHGFNEEQGDEPPLTELSSYWIAFSFLLTLFQTGISIIDSVISRSTSEGRLYNAMSRALLPLAVVIFACRLFAKPRKQDSASLWFLRAHFFIFVWMSEGAYIIMEFPYSKYNSAIHFGRAVTETVIFAYGIHLRSEVARLPNKDLNEFLVDTLFKGALKVCLLVQFVLSRNMKCVVERGSDRCFMNRYEAS